MPDNLVLPDNVPDAMREQSVVMYRHYLAMTLTLDDMLEELLFYLDRTGLTDNIIVIFTSDHGTQGGAQNIHPWMKKKPYEESMNIPWIMRWPGVFEGGTSCDVLAAPVDIFPSLYGLCGIPVPRTVEGYDLSEAWQGVSGAFEQDGILTMNFTASYDYLANGQEWRGVRTKRYAYARWLSGLVEFFDLENDPLQMTNLADVPGAAGLRGQMENMLEQ